ncbi:hypothetical protein [Frigoribacterium sp. VKM Ac-2836]|uniref:hypothetical protein n=1 Tax=Frigoribacterium sp. VKM Ac-2836 TaxID=2739014 RepID=UPI001565B44C|nr:hypothetical protein [Frigoribacterium sp. VKM Ac-2836]NRD25103.1 hypothetical protein [Frigoribacterium sp. VKM Ac-2836]
MSRDAVDATVAAVTTRHAARSAAAGGAAATAALAELPVVVTHHDPQHGVATYAAQISATVEARTGRRLALDVADLLDTPDDTARSGDTRPDHGPDDVTVPRAHLQFTDRLWGPSPSAAADVVEHLAATTALTITLHDLPQPSDGERNLRRRGEAYGRVVAAARGVVVNSEHERSLLREWVAFDGPVAVIPLPVDRHPLPDRRPEPDGDVAIIGFFYPGKGHAEVVAAVAGLAAARPGTDGTRHGSGATRPDAHATGVVALGRASSGHDAELQQLVDEAAALGVPFGATGYLDDATLVDRARRASVPVAAHQHVSASGSIATWIAAGRRPLVPDTRYSREMATLRPGTLTLYPEGGLAAAIATALVDPASTWLEDDARTLPGLDEVADAYTAWWAEGVRW